MRSWLDAHHDVGRSAVIAERRPFAHAGLVVALSAQPVLVVQNPLLERRAVVRPAGSERQPFEHARGWFERLPVHGGRANRRARAGLDLQAQRDHAIGGVADEHRRHLRGAIPPVAVEAFGHRRDLVGPGHQRALAEPLVEQLAQGGRRHVAALRNGETHDAADGPERPDESHATARRGRGLDAHVVVAPEAHHVVDGVADPSHGERLAHARLHEVADGGVHGLSLGRAHLDARNRLPHEVLRGRPHHGHGGDQRGQDDDAQAHQKACLLRTSSA
ncbi:MAG: hypothetical protein R2712_15930 [Vicinamibacterales bacterium]